MEPFVEIPSNKWPELRDLCTTNWTKDAEAYSLLDMQINYPNLSSIFNLKIYCPHGEFSNGIMKLIDMNEYYHVLIFPINTITALEEALSTTKIIDWNKIVKVPEASSDVVECFTRLSNRFKKKFVYVDEEFFTYFLSKNSPTYNLSVPANIYMPYIGPFTSNQIDLVYKTWKYCSEGTKEYFEILMNNNLTFMLYNSEDHKPLAWLVINEAGVLSHLYCLVPFRRKGYAELVTKHVCNDLLMKGRNMIPYTLRSNSSSQKLFEKLGFRKINSIYNICLE